MRQVERTNLFFLFSRWTSPSNPASSAAPGHHRASPGPALHAYRLTMSIYSLPLSLPRVSTTVVVPLLEAEAVVRLGHELVMVVRVAQLTAAKPCPSLALRYARPRPRVVVPVRSRCSVA